VAGSTHWFPVQVPPKSQSADVRHWTQVLLVVSQCWSPEQFASVLQPPVTHVFVAVLQVSPGVVQSLLERHATHMKVSVLQSGVEALPLQSVLPAHCTHPPVATLQARFPEGSTLQSIFDLQGFTTQESVPGSQVRRTPFSSEQFASLVHSTHFPSILHWGSAGFLQSC
jgi:hypothetical protein